ncbi:MAG: hypothetical protein C0483_25815 [Pirellula sp.]|nr:hypothetical protein [Pirellula sp.]
MSSPRHYDDLNHMVEQVVDHGVQADGERACVAILDDDIHIARAVAAALAALPIEVRLYTSSAEFTAALPDLNARVGCTLVDLRIAEDYGLEIIQAMSSDEASLHRPNIIISGYADVSNTLEAMTLGCWTVLQKPIDVGLLRHTVDDACHWSRTNRGRIALDCEARRVWSKINEKERSTIGMILDGLPNKTVAARLGVSIRTVENRRKQIFVKLGISSVAQLGRIVATIDMDAARPRFAGRNRISDYRIDAESRSAPVHIPGYAHAAGLERMISPELLS